jgi:hypothetical protein
MSYKNYRNTRNYRNITRHLGLILLVCVFSGSLFIGCSSESGNKKSNPKTWLHTFVEQELDSLVLRNVEGTKITMITDGDGVSNDNGQGLETEKFQQLDYRSEMDGIMEYAAINIEDNNKFDVWVDSSLNRQGLWMRIRHYSAKDTSSGLQAVDIYELEDRKEGVTGYASTSAVEGKDSSLRTKVESKFAETRTYNCYLVTWDFKQRTWWMDRDIRAYYQKGAQAFGYKIRENAIWGSPKGLDIQINLNNELWLNND